MEVFINPPDSGENEDEESDLPPASMRRAKVMTSEQSGENETNVFKKVLIRAEKLTERYIAGIILLDIASYSWKNHGFEAE